MAPVAVTPPAVQAKMVSQPARPGLQQVDTAAMGTRRKLICFSDFDGTIFMQDTGHVLFDNFGCGSELSNELYASLSTPFENGFEAMKTALDIDPDFRDFHEFCINNDIPFNVISAGLKPVLRKVLDHFLGEDKSQHIEIVANDAKISEQGQWEAVWRHGESDLGHDKARSINEYKDAATLESDNGTIPMIIFIGDGVSDLPAAREADVLFTRRGLRLEEYCIEHDLRHIPFDTFADIQKEVIKIAKVDDEKTKGRGLPTNYNPRANMWRRVSSRAAVPFIAQMTPREEKMFVWPEAFTEVAVPKESAVAPPAA